MSVFSDTALDYSLYEFDKESWFGRGPRFGNPWMSWMRGGDALGHHHHGDSVQRFARYRRPSKPVYHPKQISSPNLHKLSSKTTTANEVSFLGSFRSPTRPDFVTRAHFSPLRSPKMRYMSRKYNVCNKQSHLAYQKTSAANPNHLHLVFTYTRRKCYVTCFVFVT